MIPIWHDGDLATLPPLLQGPLAWSVDLNDAAAAKGLSTVAARADDLADAAHRSDGAVSLARRLLARALIARSADCHPDEVRIDRSAGGAPQVIAPFGWYMSLSGRNQQCLIGVARVPIGVDIEFTGNAAGCDDLMWDMMSPAEADALRMLPASKGRFEWLRRWTAKEAHAKLVGSARRIDPSSIETTPRGSATVVCEFEGRSICWSRTTCERIETIATWEPSSQSIGEIELGGSLNEAKQRPA